MHYILSNLAKKVNFKTEIPTWTLTARVAAEDVLSRSSSASRASCSLGERERRGGIGAEGHKKKGQEV